MRTLSLSTTKVNACVRGRWQALRGHGRAHSSIYVIFNRFIIRSNIGQCRRPQLCAGVAAVEQEQASEREEEIRQLMAVYDEDYLRVLYYAV